MNNLYYMLAAAAIISAGFNIRSSNAGNMSSDHVPNNEMVEETPHHAIKTKEMNNHNMHQNNNINNMHQDSTHQQANPSLENSTNAQNPSGEVIIEEETYTTEE